MQKPKRKIGQRNLWKKLYDEFILLQYEFRYELELSPQRLAKDLKHYWHQKYSEKLGFKELKDQKGGEFWSFNLYIPDNLSQIQGVIYLEDEKTIFEGTITYPTTIFAELFFATILISLLTLPVVFSNNNIYRFIQLVSFIGTFYFISTNQLASRGRIYEAVGLIQAFVMRENSRLKDKWENHNSKINDDIADDILKERRK